MDPYANDLSFLVSSARRSIVELRKMVRLAAGTERRRGGQLCTYIDAALDGIERRVATLEDQFVSISVEQDRAAVTDEMRLLNVAIRGLHETTPWLQSLTQPTLSLGVVYFLEEAAQALLGVEADLIMNSDATYMYSTLALEGPFTSLLTELGQEVPTGPSPIVINYPTLEGETAFLSPVFVHEIAHDAIDRHAIRDAIYQRFGNLDDLDKQFSSAVQSLTQFRQEAGQGISDEEAALLLRRLLNSWLEEVVCDHLALAYLGPSYLLAATAFLLPVSSAQPSHTHPPASIRMQLLLEFVDEMGWRESLEARFGELLNWFDSVAQRTREGESPDYLKFVQDAMVALSSTLREVAIDHVGDDVYRRETFEAVASELGALFENQILPVQLEDGNAIDRRAILIAGWLYRLLKHGTKPESIPAALEDVELQRFLSKALEMSFILNRWSGA